MIDRPATRFRDGETLVVTSKPFYTLSRSGPYYDVVLSLGERVTVSNGAPDRQGDILVKSVKTGIPWFVSQECLTREPNLAAPAETVKVSTLETARDYLESISADTNLADILRLARLLEKGAQ